ncbi:glucose-1-phosphate thymidylyltransferase [Robertkochia marina]|uniref:Glucose-1-phosphate thymidylyltransferase n=1 Tax=Robertkochia marina TaxID=1227945 RepID=A0A4S3M0G1_9FLAO|nr:GlmU family protein [Robertkochia marina]THD67453.1 glucose-1-phosphate thymidylyltransferase [Robertkochia marina]TRZ44677.1 glucose-1-phosphate thymidylyltransferase [Robertkochia marina]
MNYILFDGPVRNSLLPFTYTRPVADIRVGILTIREKWERYLGYTTTTVTEEYLTDLYPMVELEENILINSSFLPNEALVTLIQNLKENEAVFYGEDVVAFYTRENQEDVDLGAYEPIMYEGECIQIKNTWDIFSKNKEALEADFQLITADRESAPISSTNQVMAPENIFIEEGASVECAILNASTGPIYIGKDALVMEGSMIRGGFALGENGVVKMGAKIYGATTIGPYAKVGGEISNVVIFGYSNKGHDGYLGNSVIGEWCNIGADSNNSNLKNNYAPVRLWDYESERFAHTGLQFCGLMMGDHSKCGINTMFNTGTVIGVSANIFGSGFPRNFVPSFSWGGSAGFTTFKTEKAFEMAEAMMQRKQKSLTENEKEVLQHVFEQSARWRKS